MNLLQSDISVCLQLDNSVFCIWFCSGWMKKVAKQKQSSRQWVKWWNSRSIRRLTALFVTVWQTAFQQVILSSIYMGDWSLLTTSRGYSFIINLVVVQLFVYIHATCTKQSFPLIVSSTTANFQWSLGMWSWTTYFQGWNWVSIIDSDDPLTWIVIWVRPEFDLDVTRFN